MLHLRHKWNCPIRVVDSDGDLLQVVPKVREGNVLLHPVPDRRHVVTTRHCRMKEALYRPISMFGKIQDDILLQEKAVALVF